MIKKNLLTTLLLSSSISFISFADTDVPAKITININNEDLDLEENTAIRGIEHSFRKDNIEFGINFINSENGRIIIGSKPQMGENFYIYNITEIPKLKEIRFYVNTTENINWDKTYLMTESELEGPIKQIPDPSGLPVGNVNNNVITYTAPNSDVSYFRIGFSNESFVNNSLITEPTYLSKIEIITDAYQEEPAQSDFVTIPEKPIEIDFVTSGQTVIEHAFALNNSDFNQGKDFRISLEPKYDNNEWQIMPEDLTIEAALGEDIYKQYDELTKYETINIDGLYSPITYVTVTCDTNSNENTNNEYWYNVTATIPCSGVYNLIISSVDDVENQFKGTVPIIVYPNLYGMFGNTPGFNINGYGFTENDGSHPVKIQYYEDDSKNYVAYKPGTYFDSSFSLTIGENEYTGKRSDSKLNTSWINDIDLSSFAESSSLTLTATISKNGASKDFIFEMQKSEDIPTGIDSVEAEIETAENVQYFTIDGCKVSNPQKGIYIKLSNGRATKIIL